VLLLQHKQQLPLQVSNPQILQYLWTPSLATSKIFIIYTTTFETYSSGNRATYGIFRDSYSIATVNAVQQPSVSGSRYHTGSANLIRFA
jgi:hypothetical protein